jgi:hypothetical protein
MNSTAIISLLCVALLSGCATPIHYFNASPGSGQKLVAIPPAKTTFGIQEIRGGIQSEVLFEPTAGNTLFNGTAIFWIYTKNLDAEPFQFGPNNIRVLDINGKAVKVFSLQELVTKLQANKSKQEWGFILASSMLSALAAAPYLTTQQTGIYSGYTSTGQYVQGTYVGTQSNKTVEYLAQQENTNRVGTFSNQMNDALGRALDNVQRLTLRDVLLEKNMVVTGLVAVPLASSLPNRYRFLVQTGAGTLEYQFPIGKTK